MPDLTFLHLVLTEGPALDQKHSYFRTAGRTLNYMALPGTAAVRPSHAHCTFSVCLFVLTEASMFIPISSEHGIFS